MTTWARVEGTPRAAKPDLGLAAPVADVLWLLARQWVLGELDGDDAASPVTAQFTTRTMPIGTPSSAAPSSALLEAEIEAEPHAVDFRMRVQAGLELKRLLSDSDYARFLAAEAFRLPDLPDADAFPEPHETRIADPASRAFLDAVQDRVPDGYEIIKRHRDGNLPRGFNSARIRRVLDQLVSWFEATYTVFPEAEASNWVPSTLEYQATVHAGDDIQEPALEVDDYLGGRLDWWNFDLRRNLNWQQHSATDQSTLPIVVEFPGMPRSRYWEMEDWRIDFGQISAAPTDLLRLVLAEFALICGEGWFSIPFTVQRGSISRTERLEVTNTFGESFAIAPAGQPSSIDWDVWSTGHPSFPSRQEGPTEAHHHIVFAPATLSSTNGPAIEEVVMARDEMANMLWGIELLATNHLGEAASVPDFWGDHLAPPPPLPDDPGFYYSLITDVPRNWIPFTPIVDHSIEPARARALERIPFLRTDADRTPTLVNPLGALLSKEDPVGEGRYRLAEEAVNRIAQRIVRRFERARGPDGRVHLWVANHRIPTQPQNQSGLRFDVVTNLGRENRGAEPTPE